MKTSAFQIQLFCTLISFAIFSSAMADPSEPPYVWTEGHGHMRFDYSNTAGTWSVRFDNEDSGPPGSEDTFIYGFSLTPDQSAYVFRDILFSAGGSRRVANNSSFWQQIGLSSGDPFWFNSSGTQNALSPWMGFDSSGTFAAYVQSDPRQNTSHPLRWVTYRLHDFRYSGQGNGNMGIYITSAAGWWWNTYNGVDANDVYIDEVGHRHQNWVFTALGLYQVDVSASAYLGPGQTNPVQSPVTTFTYGVGTFAEWQLRNFPISKVMDETIAGPFADPDGDGVVNLIEYALNMNPRSPERQQMIPNSGTGGLPAVYLIEDQNKQRLVIEFVRRRAATHPQVVYHPEFTTTLQPGEWTFAGTVEVDQIDSTWERVRVIDSVASDSWDRRFARLRVELLSSIPY
jgi:surface-anchored protein